MRPPEDRKDAAILGLLVLLGLLVWRGYTR